MIRKLLFLSVILLLLLVSSSCTSYKKVPYVQTESQEVVIQTNIKNATLRFQKEDILSITVNASGEPSVASDFNLPLQPAATNENSDESLVIHGQGRQTYKVNNQGEIDYPILGLIKVEGMTQGELETHLKQRLTKYLKKEPIVTIRMMNYKISVLGEVTRPGQYGISKSQVNILEALAMAGDMSIHGRRDNIRLMRMQSDGEMKIVRLDLNDSEIVSSPYFYMKQDDILYVEPNKAKAKSSDISSQTGILISLGAMLLSVVNIVISLAK